MQTLDLELVRAYRPGVEYRADGDGLGTLHGHFSVFNQWYRVSSFFEGDFLERIAPGAFAKTIAENRNVKVLFDHGHDPQIGNKVLGVASRLGEDTVGAAYEVPLLDTTYNRDLLPGLQAGAYGSSFRFRVLAEDWHDEPAVSEHNPKGIPERTIREVQLFEFGPVTFPANPAATAGIRSMTDEFYARAHDPGYDDLVATVRNIRTLSPVESEGDSPRRRAANPSDEPREHSEDPATRHRTLRLLGVIR